MINKFPTDCCALAQLSITDKDSTGTIQLVLDQMREEMNAKSYLGTDKSMGQRAVFVITTPNELTLKARLRTLGFKPVHEFARRNGYPKGTLKMWILNL
jgi:hypothetical protein